MQGLAAKYPENYKYQINFSGLIGYVPHTVGNQLMVLIVDGKSRHQAPDKEDLFAHVPFIYYRLDDLSDKSPRRPDLTGKGYGMNFLSLEDLQIGEQPYDKPCLDFKLHISDYQIPEPVEDGDGPRSADLCWIMPIKGIGVQGLDDDLSIHQKYLQTPYSVENPNRITARFHLARGHIYNRDFQHYDFGGERMSAVCSFSRETKPGDPPMSPHHEQMISTFVTYEPELNPDEELRIKSTRFLIPDVEGVGSFPDLLFKKPVDQKRDIFVNAWNACFSDILDLFGGPDKHSWPRPTGDRSFRSYFNLCTRMPSMPTKSTDLPILTHGNRGASGYQELSWLPDKTVACPGCRYEATEFYR